MTAQNNGRPPKSLSVRILDKEYNVACPPGAETELQMSAQYLDKQMRMIRRTGKVVGLDRIAVMAGLNTAYALLKATRPAVVSESTTLTSESTEASASPMVNEKLTELKNRIDEALSAQPASQMRVPTSTKLDEENSFQVNALEVEY